MLVYRLTKPKYIRDLSGKGASMYGGRWNKRGRAVLYTGESKEITLLETIVHTPPMLLPKLSIATIEIPDELISTIPKKELPKNWFAYPAPDILAEIAENQFLKSNALALQVPSCIIHSANNYIVNCTHPDFNRVKLISVKSFYFDIRLLKI